MAEKILRCPKCDGVMEIGFVIDRDYALDEQQEWVAGKPEQAFWVGLKIDNKRTLKVVSYRCIQCGFIESYARERSAD